MKSLIIGIIASILLIVCGIYYYLIGNVFGVVPAVLGVISLLFFIFVFITERRNR